MVKVNRLNIDVIGDVSDPHSSSGSSSNSSMRVYSSRLSSVTASSPIAGYLSSRGASMAGGAGHGHGTADKLRDAEEALQRCETDIKEAARQLLYSLSTRDQAS